jgi:hypothetical protein
MSVGEGERIATRTIARTEIAFELHAPELIRCCHLGEWFRVRVVRLFFRFGLVKPARERMLPNVLAAGQSTLGSSCSSLALSFRARGRVLAPQRKDRVFDPLWRCVGAAVRSTA